MAVILHVFQLNLFGLEFKCDTLSFTCPLNGCEEVTNQFIRAPKLVGYEVLRFA